MAKRRESKLSESAGALTWLSPVVAGARLAKAGTLSARGRPDATFWLRMAGEKTFAAHEAWLAAASAMFSLQQRAFAGLLAGTPSPWSAASALGWWQQRQADGTAVAAAAMAPLARRVRKNARRPGR
jgi:hypothetical protein